MAVELKPIEMNLGGYYWARKKERGNVPTIVWVHTGSASILPLSGEFEDPVEGQWELLSDKLDPPDGWE